MSESNKRALSGEFFAMHRLFLEGYEATLTLGNTKGIDILLYNPRNDKQFKVEVKTSSVITNEKNFGGRNMNWMMHRKHENMKDSNLVYCFVFIDLKTKKARLFIVQSKEVAEYCQKQHKRWINLKHKKPIKENTDMRTFRILPKDEEKYEDSFEVFE